MTVDTLLLIGLLVVIFLLVYLLISQRETLFFNKNENASQIQKIDTLAQDINKINEGLISVTTPLGELNRFLGGNVTTGRLGEWSLVSIVQDIMPDGSYHFQHIINPQTSEQVDCAVSTADGVLVPIDSKFYGGIYKNYQSAGNDKDRKLVLRSLKTAILNDASGISEKYILQNTTSSYAILYIASEKLIDLVDKIEDLRQECLTEKRILIQGPNTLAAFLDTIRVGHHYLKLNETASKVAKVVRDVQNEFSSFDLSTESAMKKLDGAIKDVQKLQTRVNVLGRTLEKGAENLEEEN